MYDELHALARRYLFRERADHTLQPTALIHEAYLRLAKSDQSVWKSESHFVLIAARAMRQVLVNHAIRRQAQKRGGDWREIALDDAVDLFEKRSFDLVALDEALARLAEIDPRQAAIVELRFFGSLDAQAAADALNMSLRTLEREWTVARAWLRRELELK